MTRRSRVSVRRIPTCLLSVTMLQPAVRIHLNIRHPRQSRRWSLERLTLVAGICLLFFFFFLPPHFAASKPVSSTSRARALRRRRNPFVRSTRVRDKEMCEERVVRQRRYPHYGRLETHAALTTRLNRLVRPPPPPPARRDRTGGPTPASVPVSEACRARTNQRVVNPSTHDKHTPHHQVGDDDDERDRARLKSALGGSARDLSIERRLSRSFEMLRRDVRATMGWISDFFHFKKFSWHGLS